MAAFDVGAFKPQRMVVPPCWVATSEEVKGGLQASGVPFETIGASAGGRDIYGTMVGPEKPLFTFGVIGGTHGHESGGTATVMNLLSAATTGRTLAGSPADAIVPKIRWALIPLLNPDGRARCPNSFVGFPAGAVEHYCVGWEADGQLRKRQNRVPIGNPPAHLGGLFNDDGVDVLHASDGTLAGTESVEVAAAARFLKKAGCQAIIDLHAHSFRFSFYTPLGGMPESISMRGFEMAERARSEAMRAGIACAAPECVESGVPGRVDVPASALYHTVTGALMFLLEGPQGAVGQYKAFYGGRQQVIRDPGYNHQQIIDGYLFFLAALAKEFVK